jgi:hypothetical protein
MLPSWFLWPEIGGHLLLPVLQYCLWAGLTWTAEMINNPSCLETLFSPNPQPLLPLSWAVQDECPPPHFALMAVSFFLQGVWEKSLQTPESASLQFRFNCLCQASG